MFAAGTAARIGEVSGVRKGDIDRGTWLWTVRRQTTTGPGGLVDKGTKGTAVTTGWSGTSAFPPSGRSSSGSVTNSSGSIIHCA